MRRTGAVAVLAAGVFAVVLASSGSALEGYSQALHAPALLGARGQPGAIAFNLLGYVLPGVLGMLVMSGVRGRLDDAHWAARIGSRLWLLSAIAFAVQGALPLDLADMDAPTSRMHASAWTAWWLAFAPGGVLLALGLPRTPGWLALRVAAITGALLLPWFSLHAPFGMTAGVSQRLALVLWFASLVVAGFAAQRRPQR